MRFRFGSGGDSMSALLSSSKTVSETPSLSSTSGAYFLARSSSSSSAFFKIETPVASGWHRDQEAEVPASEAASASCYHLSEYVGILPIVEAELKLREIERQILRAHMMKVAHHTTLEKGPERFDCIGMHDAAYIFVLAVLDDFMGAPTIDQRVITVVLIGHNQLDVAVHGLADKSHHRLAIRFLYHLAGHITLAGNRTDHDGLSLA